MTEIEMLDSKIIDTDLFGSLTIVCNLISYDYPRAFIAKSNLLEYFAFVEHSSEATTFGWNVSKVTLDDINSVNNGEKNFQSLFKDKELYSVDYSLANNLCIVKKVDGFFDKYEIKGNLFIKNFCDMDEVFDYHGFLKTATSTNKRFIHYVIEGTQKLLAESVFKAIKYLSEICKNLDHPLDIFKSNFAVQGKSTVLTFSFDDSKKGTVFEDTNNVDENELGINELGNLLSAQDTATIIAESGKKNDVVLQKLSGLINLCGKDKINNPKIIIAKPDSTKITALEFGGKSTKNRKKSVDEARKIIKNNFSKDTVVVNLKGILTGISTKNSNSFGFEELQTKHFYSGLADFNLITKEDLFEVKGIYNATIEKTIIKNNGILLKETFKLLKLEKIDSCPEVSQLNIFD